MGVTGRRLVTAASLLVLLISVPWWIGPARVSSAQATAPKPRLRLVEQTPFVGPSGSFRIKLQVTDAPADAVLSFKLYDNTASQGRFRYLQTMRGEQLGAPVQPPYTVPVSNLPTDDNISVDATFQVDANRQPFLGFRLQQEGVYPFGVSLQTATGQDLDVFVTDLIRLPPSARNNNPPLAVSLVAPIDAPVALQTDGTSQLDPVAAAGLSETVDALADYREVPLTVAPVPETVVALEERDNESGNRVTQKLAESLDG
ncbi:MAG: hypothetical protein HYX32_11645, partial [Actinobacteria bacterium]|nr:hypothetical protein [Actinomycetota bacterium]